MIAVEQPPYGPVHSQGNVNRICADIWNPLVIDIRVMIIDGDGDMVDCINSH